MTLWKTALAGLAGLGVFATASPVLRPWTVAVAAKLVGTEVPCGWGPLLRYPWKIDGFLIRKEELRKSVRTLATEDSYVQVGTPFRPFWIKAGGKYMSGTDLVVLLLAEREFNVEGVPEARVRQGDTVVDVGAHIGTFTDFALRNGAAKVIMLEPDPGNVECLRRNFKEELASGRVVLVPEGAWDKVSSLEFSVGLANSGSGSMVNHELGASKVQVPVRPIDDILAGLGVTKVNFIKMDIEGAEANALRGAGATIRRDKPRVMLDANHLPDDSVALPKLLASLRPEYRLLTGECECNNDSSGDRFIPHTLFLH